MPEKIIDDLTDRVDISHQRKSQLRKQRAGLCLLCAEPRVNKTHCKFHREKVARENAQKYRDAHPPELTELRRLKHKIEIKRFKLGVLERFYEEKRNAAKKVLAAFPKML